MTSVQRLVSHHWRVPARPFSVDAGVPVVGTRLGEAEPTRPALVMAHGLMGWHRKPRFAVFAEFMTDWFTPYPFDLRGHGGSGGTCDFGRGEIDDVDAVVHLAREDGHRVVVTFGVSLGAIAVLRHAGVYGGVDEVVAVSSLAWWDWHEGADPVLLRRMQRLIDTPAGRNALRAWGVRTNHDWQPPQSPEEVIGKIAPTPVLLVHGEDDRLFPPAHARALYDAAREPKRLMLGAPFGHAEDGLTASFAIRLARAIYDTLGLRWSG
jgi:pimeloyl-ACP methyl ester carboxylesterase